MLWWIKDQPLPNDVLVSNPIGSPVPGVPFAAPGVPGAITVYGGDRGLGTFSGLRLAAGAWLNANSSVGVEVRGFYLFQQTEETTITRGSGGAPPTSYVIFNNVTGRFIDDYFLSSPPTAGGAIFAAASELWEVEGNAVFAASQAGPANLVWLAGLRYQDLSESFGIYQVNNPSGTVTTASSRFATTNNFYGAQFGARIGWQGARLSAELGALAAVGANFQSVDVGGGGPYAFTTNSGNRSSTQFSAIPTADLKAGYNFGANFRATLGYSFTYWSNVVRPGDQINQVLNFAPPGLISQAPKFVSTDFWAHGLSFGLELQY